MALQFIITDAGRAAIAQVGGAIGPVTLTKIAIGSAGYTPLANRTALQTEIKRLDPSGSSVPVPGTIHLTAQDDSADSYSVKEIGLYTNNNVLFAVYAQTGVILTKGSTASALFALDFVMTGVPAGTVTVGDAGFSYAQANETRLGVLAIATTAEAQAGNIDTKIITPLKLAQVTATESRRGVIALASTTEAQSLTPDATKALTVARLVDRTATTGRAGVVVLASSTDTQTGTDTGKAVTPAGLASRTATDARAGIVELADNTETQAGTDTARAVTPAGLKSTLGAYSALTHTHAASAIVSGTIENDRLPARLKSFAQTINDWNLATENGWYQGSKASNAPEGFLDWWIGIVEVHNDLWVTQTVHRFTADAQANTHVWRRSSSDNGSGSRVWNAWYKLQLSQEEQDARYSLGFTPVQQGGGAGQGTNKLHIGWGTTNTLLLQVDSTNFESTWPINISGTANPVAHTHDDRYYTETEVDTLLAGKQAAGSYAPDSHTHAASAIVSGTIDNARLTKATSSASGIVELATNTETQTGTDATRAVTPASLASAGALFVPPGAVMPFARTSAPSGWLPANGNTIGSAASGAVYDSQNYNELFAVLWGSWSNTLLPIQTSTGAASTRGATAAADFAENKRLPLPDMRGYFVRGSGTNADGTVAGAFGAKQADAFETHSHSVNASGGKNLVSSLYSKPGSGDIAYTLGGTGGVGYGLGPNYNQKNTDATGGTETRPKNIALLYCIKF